MRAIQFKGVNVQIAKDQDEFHTLPANIENGLVTSCFQLSPDEIEVLLNSGGKIYYQQHIGTGPMQGMNLSVTNPLTLPDVIEPTSEPHGCMDYSQGSDRCETQCDKCREHES